MGDHTESIQIDFDPSRITYQELLETLFLSHDPFAPMRSVQYRAFVFAHDEAQENAARESLAELGERAGRDVTTGLVTGAVFHLAEDYHQKYALRGDRRMLDEFRAFGYDETMLRESTAAARVNGYLYGYGSRIRLEEELSELGLSRAGKAALREAVVSRGRA